MIFWHKSGDVFKRRSRALRLPTVKPRIAGSPASGIRMGLRVGLARSRIAQHVSALFAGDELRSETNLEGCVP